MITSFKDYLGEAVQLSLYRKFYKRAAGIQNKKYEKIWNKHIKDDPRNNEYRLFFPFKKEDEALKVDQEIIDVLTNNGYECTPEMYYIGTTYKTDTPKNLAKIGGVLGKLKRQDLVTRYAKHITDLTKQKNKATDKQYTREDLAKRVNNLDSKTIVLSRHLYDFIGQSEDRTWSYDSCKRLTDQTNKDKLRDPNGGAVNWIYIPEEFSTGYLIAYVIDEKENPERRRWKRRHEPDANRPKNDPLVDPISRVMMIPYYKEDDPTITRLFVSSEQVFGVNLPSFVDRCDEILDELKLRYLEPHGLYCVPNGGYGGTVDSTKRHQLTIRDLAKECIQKLGEENVEYDSEAGDIYIGLTDIDFVNECLDNYIPYGQVVQQLLPYDGTDEETYEYIDNIVFNDITNGADKFLQFLHTNGMDYEANDEDGVKDEVFSVHLPEFIKTFGNTILNRLSSNVNYLDRHLFFNEKFNKVQIRIGSGNGGNVSENNIKLAHLIFDKKYHQVGVTLSAMNNFNQVNFFNGFNIFSSFLSNAYYNDTIDWWADRLGIVDGEQPIKSNNSSYSITTKTGLEVCTGIYTYIEYNKLNTLAAGCKLGNHTDWKIPSIYELRIIYEEYKTNKELQKVIKDHEYYWSSTEAADGAPSQRVFDFEDGMGYTQDRNTQVVNGMLVREA